MIDPTRLIHTRSRLVEGLSLPARKLEAEGGCGVIGVACTERIEGRYLLQALVQMKNRGNGKGGGIAAAGLSPQQMGVSPKILEEDYIVQVAYLDPSVRERVEGEHIYPVFDVHEHYRVDRVEDYRSMGLEVPPPEVYRYFVRVREEVLRGFVETHGLQGLPAHRVEDEIVYQNSYMLNRKFYSSLGEKKAFVLSHGKNMIVLKLVGYGDDVIRYYKLEDLSAHVWIGHHRYPTKGRVWHPGGAHPFVGLHQALVHNGDFSNYHTICEYLAQRNMYPLFLTDTEVAALLFDLWRRVYGYDMEYLLEAMAPTTERDFYMLPESKRRIYHQIQVTHIHGSPDGPWFFIVAESDPYNKMLHLLGITDTSMLRPQVFCLQDNDVQIGVIASERQAINALLRSLARDGRIPYRFADIYWNARGGSWTDGGAFIYTVRLGEGRPTLICTDKFGRVVGCGLTRESTFKPPRSEKPLEGGVKIEELLKAGDPLKMFEALADTMRRADYSACLDLLDEVKRCAKAGEYEKGLALQCLTLLFDRPFDLGGKKRGRLLEYLEDAINEILDATPLVGSSPGSLYARVDWERRLSLPPPGPGHGTLVIDSLGFPSEGDESLARFIVAAHRLGWRRLIVYNTRGQRFIGSGLGPRSHGTRIDVYGDSGDYLASGLDGAEIHVHGAGQDQLANIMRAGRLVVHGDVGQTFMYAAKGGEVFVLGNAAGRPLINAVGSPRVVINGTCLDYLAESFMAGDPLNGGGFAILNGVRLWEGRLIELDTPYPGSNLFSLASGGAIYIRDPRGMVEENQLNGGELLPIDERDWSIIHPMLVENQELFGIKVDDLLTVDGIQRPPTQVYRKVVVRGRPKELE